MRSRTGCLTCRQRKLKCDEMKPRCGQCCKASRECVPSSGIVFRHQHNASMNGNRSQKDNSLKGFYAYRNTFDDETIWLDIPRNVTFINTTNPYLDPDYDFDSMSATSGDSPMPFEPRSVTSWPAPNRCSPPTSTPSSEPLHSTGLCYTPQLETPASHDASLMLQSPQATSVAPMSPPLSLANAHFQSLLHDPLSLASSPLDPCLGPFDPLPDQTPRSSSIAASRTTPSYTGYTSERDYETAYLLRWFSEGPGYWMDLFDVGAYFSSYVPVKAHDDVLLQYAALAYSAKALARVRGRKPIMGGSVTRQAEMETYPDAHLVDWGHKATQYYDIAVSLLLEALKANAVTTPDSESDAGELFPGPEGPPPKRRRKSSNTPTQANTDELLAASAILCAYEFLDGSVPEWARHLNGAKSLLVIAQERMASLQMSACISMGPSANIGFISKARRATFWNIARQDVLAALINKTRTRLDTEDLTMWKEAGLLIDEGGLIIPSNAIEDGYADGESMMKEDLICNALVWLMGKLGNFMASGDDPGGEAGPTWTGVAQRTLLKYWDGLRRQFQVWYEGLPITFQSSARIEPRRMSMFGEPEALFPEVWYSIPMCASTMQCYHMSQIHLFMSKPHASTQGGITVHERLSSYQSVLAACQKHSREIVGISLGRPDEAVRIHSVQPLFTAGQCLSDMGERQVVLNLLRGIETDIGWATDYRVKQLIKQWQWDDSDQTLVT